MRDFGESILELRTSHLSTVLGGLVYFPGKFPLK
jgi:hypothetical protein